MIKKYFTVYIGLRTERSRREPIFCAAYLFSGSELYKEAFNSHVLASDASEVTYFLSYLARKTLGEKCQDT
jgi:hypothetical protein